MMMTTLTLRYLPQHQRGSRNTRNVVVAISSRSRNKSTLSSTATATATAAPSFDFPRIRDEIVQQWLVAESQTPLKAKNLRAQYCCFTYQDGLRAYQQPHATWHWLDRELSSNLAGETGAVYIYKGALSALDVLPSSRKQQNHQEQNLDAVRAFCRDHMAHEAAHLACFEAILPSHAQKRTRLLPLWRMAGWLLGFLPTYVGGPKALYVTVVAVESFVEEHYQQQIVRLKEQYGLNGKDDDDDDDDASNSSRSELLRLLEHCCAEEVHHRDDAAERLLLHSKDSEPKDVAHQESSSTSSHAGVVDRMDALAKQYWWVLPWSQIVKTGSLVAAEVARRI